MPNEIQLTAKQCEYVRDAKARWNIAIGAVRSGKSHLAVQDTIPEQILARKGLKGLNMILGATRDNIERNVLEPMREIWGESVISEINSKNVATIAGEKVYCFGADNRGQVRKIRGSEIKYCYCDEICDINEEVFQMLKSRLSLEYSRFDGAANPAGPNHWVKKFIDTPGLDLYCQKYTIYDNPFLPESYVRSLEIEYAGTVFYDRYILGEWKQAEGLIYPNHNLSVIEIRPEAAAKSSVVSIDYGTLNAFAAILWEEIQGVWYAVDEYYYSGRETGQQKTDSEYADDLESWIGERFKKTKFIIDPSAASFITELRKRKATVKKAKNDVSDGIRHVAGCMNSGSIKITKKCKRLIGELEEYSWDDRADKDQPIKENDHACDALRYFVETMKIWREKEYKYHSAFGN